MAGVLIEVVIVVIFVAGLLHNAHLIIGIDRTNVVDDPKSNQETGNGCNEECPRNYRSRWGAVFGNEVVKVHISSNKKHKHQKDVPVKVAGIESVVLADFVTSETLEDHVYEEEDSQEDYSAF